MAEHTKGEWKASGNGVHVGINCVAIAYDPNASDGRGAEAHANAAFITRAVNSHDELIQLLTEAFDVYESLKEEDGDIADKQMKRIRAAIAKATGDSSPTSAKEWQND